MIFDLLGIPAAANAEQKAAVRDLVERGDELGSLNRVALDYQAHPGAELEALRDRRRDAQRHKRVHHLVITLRQFAAAWRRGSPRHRDVRMLRDPQRLEATLLESQCELGRRDRVVGKKDRRTEFHDSHLRRTLLTQWAFPASREKFAFAPAREPINDEKQPFAQRLIHPSRPFPAMPGREKFFPACALAGK